MLLSNKTEGIERGAIGVHLYYQCHYLVLAQHYCNRGTTVQRAEISTIHLIGYIYYVAMY